MDFAHRISHEFEAVGVVDQTVENRICESGVWDSRMPIAHRNLCGDQGGGAAIAVVQDFEQVLGLRTRKGIPEPVIEDQEVDAGEGAKHLGIRAIGLSEFEGLE